MELAAGEHPVADSGGRRAPSPPLAKYVLKKMAARCAISLSTFRCNQIYVSATGIDCRGITKDQHVLHYY